jgi:hypothetical protein
MRRTAEYTWTENKTNTEIAKESNITLVLDTIQHYKINLIQHVNRMSRNRLFRLITNYTPKGKRNQGRQPKRLLDATSGPNPGIAT